MRTTKDFFDYEILDASAGEKLERWGEVLFIRPDPQIIWHTAKSDARWEKATARYVRSNKGGGQWEFYQTLKQQSFEISYRHLKFLIRPTGFKHTGLFPEQATNWDLFDQKIKQANRPLRVLNLFAYTGGATLACAAAGAEVCHVDASKGMVAWAKQNAGAAKLQDKPIRYIVDDCEKFVAREIKRGSYYDAIILDPPSYGRGPSGEVWQLEQRIYDLLCLCGKVLSKRPLFVALNSYTTGLSPAVMAYLLHSVLVPTLGGAVRADEIGLPVRSSEQILPCGSTALWETK